MGPERGGADIASILRRSGRAESDAEDQSLPADFLNTTPHPAARLNHAALPAVLPEPLLPFQAEQARSNLQDLSSSHGLMDDAALDHWQEYADRLLQSAGLNLV